MERNGGFLCVVMNKFYIEKRPVIGGGFNTYKIEETNEWKGQILGTELTNAHKIFTIDTDHFDNEDEDGIKFGWRWVKKSLIQAIVFQTDSCGMRTVARVRFARPIEG
mgnify:CR=1 FL=1